MKVICYHLDRADENKHLVYNISKSDLYEGSVGLLIWLNRKHATPCQILQKCLEEHHVFQERVRVKICKDFVYDGKKLIDTGTLLTLTSLIDIDSLPLLNNFAKQVHQPCSN